MIELGELSCDSVDEAPSSTTLRFAISSEEVLGRKVVDGPARQQIRTAEISLVLHDMQLS